jgi:hypothetical protein
MQAKGSPTDLLRILALCTSRILGRLTADPLLCITDRSFVSRLFRLSKERGCSRVPSFFFGSDCGLAPTQEEPNHERCASLQNHSFRADNPAASRGGQTMFRLAHCVPHANQPTARESPGFRSLTAAICQPNFAFFRYKTGGRRPRRGPLAAEKLLSWILSLLKAGMALAAHVWQSFSPPARARGCARRGPRCCMN